VFRVTAHHRADGHRPLTTESVRLSQADIASPPTHHDFLHIESRHSNKAENPDSTRRITEKMSSSYVEFESISGRRTWSITSEPKIGFKPKAGSQSNQTGPPPRQSPSQHRRSARAPPAASAAQGESRAIYGIYGNCRYPRTAPDRGNNFSSRDNAIRATTRRNRDPPRSPAHPSDIPTQQGRDHGTTTHSKRPIAVLRDPERRRSNQETPLSRTGEPANSHRPQGMRRIHLRQEGAASVR
jgi:hypothetical protein